MNIVDLHVHSNKSDGSLTPRELVALAVQKGLSAFALTDHDTVAGLSEALQAAAEYNSYIDAAKEAAGRKKLEVIPGIEFSTEYEGKDVHIIGLYINYKAPFFKDQARAFADSRTERNYKMCANLKAAGVDISYEKLLAAFPDAVITRGHYAKYMLDQGYVKSMPEAFERYIGDHARCYVPREKVTPAQAVALILRAGGLPVLAHPVLYHMSDERLELLVSRLKEAGLIALEAVYSSYSTGEERKMRRLADKYGLYISGGSDFHGSTKSGLNLATGYGKLFIPEEILDNLKKKLKSRRKIFFTDLDGTLLTGKKDITPATRKALEAWTSAGHKFVLCSGRANDSVRNIKETLSLNFPGMYLVGSNGGEIYDCEQQVMLSRTPLTMEQVSLIMELAKQWDVHCHTYTDTHIISPADNEELKYYKRAIHTPVIVTKDILSALDKAPCKCIAIELHNKEKLEGFRKSLLARSEGELQLVYSSPFYLEIISAASGKGSAVRTLCRLLDIPLENALAAGDEANDISMIEAAGIGIAMQNGRDEVKKAAGIITENDNDHDGLADILLQNI